MWKGPAAKKTGQENHSAALYQVVANAFVFVFGQLLIHFLDLYPPPFDSATIAIRFVQLVFRTVSMPRF